MRLQTLVLSALVLYLLVIAGVLVAHAKDPELSGAYRCEGFSNGEKYTGFVHIRQNGEAYELLWTNDAGQPTGVGLGLRTRDVLSVVFQTPGGVSIAAYTIERNGTLSGRWFSGEGKTSPERLTHVPAGHAPGPADQSAPAHPRADDPRVRVAEGR